MSTSKKLLTILNTLTVNIFAIRFSVYHNIATDSEKQNAIQFSPLRKIPSLNRPINVMI